MLASSPTGPPPSAPIVSSERGQPQPFAFARRIVRNPAAPILQTIPAITRPLASPNQLLEEEWLECDSAIPIPGATLPKEQEQIRNNDWQSSEAFAFNPAFKRAWIHFQNGDLEGTLHILKKQPLTDGTKNFDRPSS